jgi:hypothetical protein
MLLLLAVRLDSSAALELLSPVLLELRDRVPLSSHALEKLQEDGEELLPVLPESRAVDSELLPCLLDSRADREESRPCRLDSRADRTEFLPCLPDSRADREDSRPCRKEFRP